MGGNFHRNIQGYIIESGKLMKDYYEDHDIENPPPVILLYSLGWTFKF